MFPPVRGMVGYLPMAGNVGDRLIDLAAERLLNVFHPDHRILQQADLDHGMLPKNLVRIYVAGGGNLGGLYRQNTALRARALATGVPVTVLPQSWTGGEEALDGFDTIWARERSSQRRIPGARLGPDLALSLDLPPPESPGRNTTGLFLRSDGEGLFGDFPASLGDPVALSANLVEYLDLAATFRHIATDRLHFAIAGLLMGRRVTLLPNSYYKNRSLFTTWLRDLGCQWADTPDEVDRSGRPRLSPKRPSAERLLFAGAHALRIAPGWTVSRRDDGTAELHHAGLKIDHGIPPETAIAMDRLGDDTTRAGKMENALRPAFNLGAVNIDRGPQPFIGAGRGVPLEITVHPPREINGGVLSVSDVRLDGCVRPLWFYLADAGADEINPLADAHLLAMLFPAMVRNQPIWLRGAAVSPGLLENLEQFQQIWSLWASKYHVISIDAGEGSTGPNGRGTLCAFSGGVDSTFSVLYRNLQADAPQRPVDTALSVRGLDIPWRQVGDFRSRSEQTRDTLDRAGVRLRTLSTNLRDFDQDWEFTHGAATAAAMSLLAPGHRRALLPATFHVGILYPWGSTPMTDHLLGSDRLSVICDGAGYTRAEKLRWLGMHAPESLETLRFCWWTPSARGNCGHCQKCLVTAVMMRLAGLRPRCFSRFPSDRTLAAKLADIPLSRLDRYELSRIRQQLDSDAWPAPPGLAAALSKRLDQ